MTEVLSTIDLPGTGWPSAPSDPRASPSRRRDARRHGMRAGMTAWQQRCDPGAARQWLPLLLLATVIAFSADGKLVRGPPEMGRSATEGMRELARAKRSARNTAEARKALRGNAERYLLANPFGAGASCVLPTMLLVPRREMLAYKT